MAYADIQNKVSQIQMANRVLLAQRMNPNKTPETDLSGFQEQGGYIDQETIDDLQKADKEKKLDPRTISNRKKKAKQQAELDEEKKRQETKEEMEEFYKGPSDKTIRERQAAIDKIKGRLYGGPVEDAKRQDDMKRGDYLQDPEQPFNINTLLQIGGAVGGGIVPLLQQLLIRNPNAMAMDMKDAVPRGGFFGLEKTNVIVNDGGEAYIVEPNGNFKFDGFYDPVRHGPMFPGYVQNQSNDEMKIAKLPHTLPTEKMVVGKKLMDSPLRFRTDAEREQYMLDYSKNFRYDGT